MRAYMAYDYGGKELGAILVFANNLKEAKKLAYPALLDWFDLDFLDMRTVWLKNSPYLFKEANQELLKNNIPHVIDSPTICKNCELWGNELDINGFCSECVPF